jgi:hypothetical protein
MLVDSSQGGGGACEQCEGRLHCDLHASVCRSSSPDNCKFQLHQKRQLVPGTSRFCAVCSRCTLGPSGCGCCLLFF